jgi:hypothetical protein
MKRLAPEIKSFMKYCTKTKSQQLLHQLKINS